MLTTNTRKCIVMGACVGMIILDVVLMIASNVDHIENGYSNTDTKYNMNMTIPLPHATCTFIVYPLIN